MKICCQGDTSVSGFISSREKMKITLYVPIADAKSFSGVNVWSGDYPIHLLWKNLVIDGESSVRFDNLKAKNKFWMAYPKWNKYCYP